MIDKNRDEVVFESEGERKLGDKGKKISSLEEKLKTCEKERKEYLDGWKRAKADAINEKNRLLSIGKDEYEKGVMQSLESFLPVIDSINLAIKDSEDSGLKSILNQITDAVSSLGCKLINPIDEKFNPEEQEAVERVEIYEKNKDNVVVEVVRFGCSMDGKIIRPSMVKVGNYKSK